MFKEKQQIEIMNDTAFLVTVIIFPKHDNASIIFSRIIARIETIPCNVFEEVETSGSFM